MVHILKKGASKREIENINKKLSKVAGVNTKKYCGQIKLKEDPMEIQKMMRDEWK